MPKAVQYKNEDGRNIATASHSKGTIEVAAGYDIGNDKFRYHVYVTKNGGVRERAHVGTPYAESLDAAFEAGFRAGRDQLGG